MIKLASKLDMAHIPYVWIVFTDSPDKIQYPNIVCLQQRLDITPFIAEADYLVQLSDKGERIWLFSS